MNKTGIEYLDWTWNPVVGCYGPGGTKEIPRLCSYCWAKKMAARFKPGNGFAPSLLPDRLSEKWPQKPSRIGVCFMSDLFGDWVPTDWIKRTIYATTLHPEHVHVFLTKNPKRLPEFNPWPANAWVGFSATGPEFYGDLCHMLSVMATVKFVSLEPLLSDLTHTTSGREIPHVYGLHRLDWIVIGARTNPLKLPTRKAVDDIEYMAVREHVPVFEKASLATLFPERKLRQEYPK